MKIPGIFRTPFITTEFTISYGKLMFLTEMSQSDRGRITAITGCRHARQHLALRGLSEGCIIKVISSGCGPVVVEVKGITLAIGRGMAGRIRVLRIEN